MNEYNALVAKVRCPECMWDMWSDLGYKTVTCLNEKCEMFGKVFKHPVVQLVLVGEDK